MSRKMRWVVKSYKMGCREIDCKTYFSSESKADKEFYRLREQNGDHFRYTVEAEKVPLCELTVDELKKYENELSKYLETPVLQMNHEALGRYLNFDDEIEAPSDLDVTGCAWGGHGVIFFHSKKRWGNKVLGVVDDKWGDIIAAKLFENHEHVYSVVGTSEFYYDDVERSIRAIQYICGDNDHEERGI